MEDATTSAVRPGYVSIWEAPKESRPVALVELAPSRCPEGLVLAVIAVEICPGALDQLAVLSPERNAALLEGVASALWRQAKQSRETLATLDLQTLTIP